MRVDQKPDFYEILGVSRDASQDEIKKSYRRLAREYHPDVNPGDDEAEARFKEISQAYQTLKDPEKRGKYDQFGEAWEQAQHTGQWQQGDFREFINQQYGAGSFRDVFGDLFGDMGGGRGFTFSTGGGRGGMRAQQGPQRGPDVEYEMPVTFDEAVHGAEKEISLTLSDRCPDCEGIGGQTETCPACGGTGQAQSGGGFFNLGAACPQCHGTGQVVTTRCRTCRGSGEATRRRRIKVNVPAGVETGSKVRVRGEGGRGAAGGPPGDLILNIRVQPHPVFKRDGNDIRMELPLAFTEAALGARVKVPTIDGPVTMTIPAGTQSGQELRLKGRGVKRPGVEVRGDQYVEISVKVPEKLSSQQREMLEQFDETWKTDPRRDLRV
ncbi:MAG: molecular chaperone DnaJ [candidate division WS1 bacterium]|nr:molecular chaperone DnaJ [candidate division WS1 bacterium]